MSSLLDEAIVDAKALREAVLKNAEASLLEAYAPKIEEAVEKLLEQDPAAGALPMDMGVPPDMGAPPGGLGMAPEEPDETGATFTEGEEEDLGDMQYAALTELDDDTDLLDEEEIDITRGELQAMLESITHDIESLEEGEGCEEVTDDDDEITDDDEVLEEEQVEIDEEIIEAFEGDSQEGIEITEDNIDDIVESLVVDICATKSGWAGTPEPVMQHNEKLVAAMAQSDHFKEENEDLLKVGKQLAESVKKYKTSNNKLKEIVNTLKNKLEEVNLTNAKLFYTNRVLRSSSLNERQKYKIVETLSDAGSVNEAKVLYETLQNAVGPSRKEGPQSLSEAVSRPSSMLPRRKSQNNDSNPFTDRMKILAGIKDN